MIYSWRCRSWKITPSSRVRPVSLFLCSKEDEGWWQVEIALSGKTKKSDIIEALSEHLEREASGKKSKTKWRDVR